MDIWNRAETACSECEVLLVAGTAAAVYPAAGLIELARRRGAGIIVVNTNRSEASDAADVEVIGSVEDVLPQLLAAS
tara:strand:+ start:199 stop:429 length:231 start_codon:yes stop_codon:yes gene_type:complete